MIGFVALPIGTLVWIAQNGIEYFAVITHAGIGHFYGGQAQYNHRAKVIDVMTQDAKYGWEIGDEIPFVNRTEIQEVLDGYAIYYS
jgi:hypothetical protein